MFYLNYTLIFSRIKQNKPTLKFFLFFKKIENFNKLNKAHGMHILPTPPLLLKCFGVYKFKIVSFMKNWIPPTTTVSGRGWKDNDSYFTAFV